MNCAERLVEIFGSQAEVARAFQLDRAVVNHWVKIGYVPARWATEVERIATLSDLGKYHGSWRDGKPVDTYQSAGQLGRESFREIGIARIA